MSMAKVLAEGMPDRLEWLKNQANAMIECGDTAGALQLLKDASERFGEDGKYHKLGKPPFPLILYKSKQPKTYKDTARFVVIFVVTLG